jgi:hypothetical protein
MSYVCAECISERWLAAYIKNNADEHDCDLCGRTSQECIATELNDIMGHIRERVESIYEDPANSVGYESAEGGYQLSTMDTYEILDEVGLSADCRGRAGWRRGPRETATRAGCCYRPPGGASVTGKEIPRSRDSFLLPAGHVSPDGCLRHRETDYARRGDSPRPMSASHGASARCSCLPPQPSPNPARRRATTATGQLHDPFSFVNS